MKATDYVDKYISICSQLCRKPEDYTKENVIKHNKAMKKLEKLKKNIRTDSQLADYVYSELLNCTDEHIRQSAATDCLYLKIHTTASINILKKIAACGDRMSAMGAKRTLLIWEGRLDPQKPF